MRSQMDRPLARPIHFLHGVPPGLADEILIRRSFANA
jgi:hypothetical protein